MAEARLDRKGADSSSIASAGGGWLRSTAGRAHGLLGGYFARERLPQTRDQLMLAMVALNELFLGLEVYLAHGANGTIVADEWLPSTTA